MLNRRGFLGALAGVTAATAVTIEAKPNFSFKGDDLNPLAPQFAIVMEILKQAGVKTVAEHG